MHAQYEGLLQSPPRLATGYCRYMLIQGIAAIRALWIAPLLQASRPQSFSGHLSLPSFPTDVLFFPPPDGSFSKHPSSRSPRIAVSLRT
ncbi:hypothetical protein AMECASPLE_016452 [Ameca splendens]|uniref:Uncharacterized protein n=1 Tax=Ameca splendens TaxID=208324 RepID=A0ABV1A9E0_9TELE